MAVDSGVVAGTSPERGRCRPVAIRRVRPQEGGQALGKVECRACVGHRRIDLRAVPHDPDVRQESGRIAFVKLCDRLDGEVGERRAERRPLAQNRDPRESGLECLEREALIDAVVGAHRAAPLVVVVGPVIGRAVRPRAAGSPVFADGEALRDDVPRSGRLHAERRIRFRLPLPAGLSIHAATLVSPTDIDGVSRRSPLPSERPVLDQPCEALQRGGETRLAARPQQRPGEPAGQRRPAAGTTHARPPASGPGPSPYTASRRVRAGSCRCA